MPLAPPFKPKYTDISETGGSQSEKVGAFYNSYGWLKRAKYNVPDDNLGLELLFLTILNDKYISLDDEACRVEMRNEIRRFIRLHILSWISEWYERMQEHADTLCYRGIATLILASCEDIYNLFDNSDSSEKKFMVEFMN